MTRTQNNLFRLILAAFVSICAFWHPALAENYFWQERVVELRDPVEACSDASRLVTITYPVREPDSEQRFQTDIQVLREYPQTAVVADKLVSRLQKHVEVSHTLEELRSLPASSPQRRRLQEKADELVRQAQSLAREIAEIMSGVDGLLRQLIAEKVKSGAGVKAKERERYQAALPQERPERERRPIPLLPRLKGGGNRCPLPKIPLRTPTELPPTLSGLRPRTMDYRVTFFEFYPEFSGELSEFVEVHHAVPQIILTKYPGLFTPGEIHLINNLRGICVPWRSYIHQDITRRWDEWFRRHPQRPNRQEVIDESNRVDDIYGEWFDPPVYL